jgi:uncharacterized protein
MTDRGSAITLDTKAVSEDGEFEGYASTFGNIDQGRDIVVKGAFANSLKVRPAGKVKLLRQHDWNSPIGVLVEAKEDSRGLFVKGKLVLESALARETHALMKAGALDSMSIGFRVIRDEFDRVKQVRKLLEIDLRECSIVTFAMNESAAISAVKADDEHARRVVAALNRAARAFRA